MVNWEKLSPAIHSVLTQLKEVVSGFGKVRITESKYWIRFKVEGGRAFASLHPSRYNVRVFISCDENLLNDPLGWAKTTPSTKSWAKVHPLVFNIRGSEDIDYAVKLLKQAYEYVKGRSV